MILVSYIDILDYLGDDRQSLIKGEELFNEKKIQNVHVSRPASGNVYEVSAVCVSQDTNGSTDSHVSIVINQINHCEKKSLASECSCELERSGKCHHVAATLIHLHRYPPDQLNDSLRVKPSSVSAAQPVKDLNGDAVVKQEHNTKDINQQSQRQLRYRRRSTGTSEKEKNLNKSVITKFHKIEKDHEEELVDDPTWDKENDCDDDEGIDWTLSSDDDWEPELKRKRMRKEIPLIASKDSKDISKNRKKRNRITKAEADLKAKEIVAAIDQGNNGLYSCHMCDVELPEIDQLHDHFRDIHLLKKEVLMCGRCKRSFKLLRTLKAHEASCDAHSYQDGELSPTHKEVDLEDEEENEAVPSTDVLQCLMCKVVSTTRREMHDHYLVAHEKDSVAVCDRCGEFRLPRDHTCPSQLAFHCHMCRSPFKVGRDYWNHLIRASKQHGLSTSHPRRGSRAPSWRCGWPRCAERFGSEEDLMAHVRLHLPVHVQLMCSVCMLVLRNTDAKIVHMEKHDAGVYECGACRHACDDREALREHWETHAQERPHRCDVCGWRFVSAATLQVHVRKFHEGGPFSCAKCPQKFDDRTEVRIHFGAAHGKLRCSVAGCSYRCANKASLDRHGRQHEDDPEDERTFGGADAAPPLACATCGETFALRRELRAHARDVHGEVGAVKCPECCKAFKSQRDVDEHRRSHTGEKPFICAECGMTFKRAQNLEYHTKGAHKNERNFVCPECGKRFISNADMKRHLRYNHQDGKKWHLCPQCGHKLPSLYNLKLHVQSRHTGERPHKCHLCDMGFVASSDLKKHVMFKHNKEHPFPCPSCDKRYQRRRDLELHQKRHHEGARHTCPTCAKDFDTYASMMQHARYHTTEEPFQCAKCGRRFPHRMNLSRHLCTPDIKKNYHCVSCGLSFTTSGSLKSHRRRLHASEASAQAPAQAPAKPKEDQVQVETPEEEGTRPRTQTLEQEEPQHVQQQQQQQPESQEMQRSTQSHQTQVQTLQQPQQLQQQQQLESQEPLPPQPRLEQQLHSPLTPSQPQHQHRQQKHEPYTQQSEQPQPTPQHQPTSQTTHQSVVIRHPAQGQAQHLHHQQVKQQSHQHQLQQQPQQQPQQPQQSLPPPSEHQGHTCPPVQRQQPERPSTHHLPQLVPQQQQQQIVVQEQQQEQQQVVVQQPAHHMAATHHQLHHQHHDHHLHHEHPAQQQHSEVHLASPLGRSYEDYGGKDKLWRGVRHQDPWELASPVAPAPLGPVATTSLAGEEAILTLGCNTTYHELESAQSVCQPQPLVLGPHPNSPPPPSVLRYDAPSPADATTLVMKTVQVKADVQQNNVGPHMVYATPTVKLVSVSQPPPLTSISTASTSTALQTGQGLGAVGHGIGQGSLILGAPIQTTADGSFHLVFVPHTPSGK